MAVEMYTQGTSSSMETTSSTKVETKTASVPAQLSENTGSMVSSSEEKDDPDKKQQNDPSEDAVKDVLSQVNSKVKNGTKCEFRYHEGTHRISITIKDKDTDEVLKEIPPKESLDMLQRLWEMAGLIVDEKR